ncbi:hypothetical protein [Flagellimonas sp. CMM7]|uniref:hypothetical protein n=1 Tax=Flagellimonas sp. CMM7 TaxID=2654676 RepID=UPI0013D7C461|nr:hypothetical protein [Flagellimonas sp. CMM7]UII79154.1 hypothetical protein LV704_16020 [Flagellimonas sp. CMM7]
MKQRVSIYSDTKMPRLVFPLLIGLVILITGVVSSISNKRKRDTEFAYQETRRALSLLTSNFNRGVQKMTYLREFETAKQKIYNY